MNNMHHYSHEGICISQPTSVIYCMYSTVLSSATFLKEKVLLLMANCLREYWAAWWVGGVGGGGGG